MGSHVCRARAVRVMRRRALFVAVLLWLPAASVADAIYWSDWFSGGVYRMDLDNPQVETVLSPGSCYPYQLAVDDAAGKVYWTDGSTHGVMRANLDGTGYELLSLCDDG